MKLFDYGTEESPKIGKAIIHSLLAVFLVLPILWGSWGIIRAGERGVKLRMGAVVGTIDSGMYFKFPYFESVKKMNVQVQKDETESAAASKDLQTVSSKLAVNFMLSPDYVASMYQNTGMDYKSVLLDPNIQESIKAATANYTAEELITKREVVKDDIHKILTEKLLPYGIIIKGVNITNFDFSPSFNTAVESKVTAEQSALAAKNKLEQVKFEAEQRISQAKGEAEAIKIQASAIQNQGGSDYVKLQWIKQWDGKLPVTSLGNSNGVILDLGSNK